MTEQSSGLLIREFGVQVPGGAPVLTWHFRCQVFLLSGLVGPAPAENLIRAGGSRCASGADVVTDAGIRVVRSGVRMPRMNSIMERWVQTCRRELLDQTLIWNQPHLLHALREFEEFYNGRTGRTRASRTPARSTRSPHR